MWQVPQHHPSSGEGADELIQVGWVWDGHPSVVDEGWTQQVPPHCLLFWEVADELTQVGWVRDTGLVVVGLLM
jgi:hypothetical protein